VQLAGRVALVTGAGRGIGRAIAHALARESVAVAVNSIGGDSAERTCRELQDLGFRAVAVPADASCDSAVAGMVQEVNRELGPIDILINNAAAPASNSPFAESTLADQNSELVTLLATFTCSRYVCPEMIKRRSGRIVNISSIAGRHGMPLRAVYSAANSGIDAFTRSLAKELGPFGITVNCVSPGATETPRFRARSPEVRESVLRAIALKRFAEPEEIAHAVVFLASNQAAYINGAILDVDGGFCGYMPPKTCGGD
jgi:NAD(P)-dependent dehydrogenase (short-subunit alcohol dehydrogenase family)